METSNCRIPAVWLALFRMFLGALWISQALAGDSRAWLVGIPLVLGLFTPLAALGAFALVMGYSLHAAQPPHPGTPAYAAVWGAMPLQYYIAGLSLLTAAATRAGRAFGLDAFLAARRPGSLIW